MVLAELGQKIAKAISSMSNSTVIDEEVLKKMLSQIAMALLQSDVDIQLVRQLQENIKKAVNLEDVAAGVNKRKIIQTAVVNELMALLDPKVKVWAPTKGKSNVIMFVGLQGSGKTTTCTKLAYFYRRKGYKVALVCADTFRAGAYDQLKQNATKAKIPYYGSYTEPDPALVAEAGVAKFKTEKFDIIIVDTSGRHMQEEALFAEMQEVARAVTPDQVIFVMDSSIGQAAKDQAAAFKNAVAVGSVIITKLDGHAKGGGALSAVAATKSPVIFVGTGEHMDDLEPFNARSFVSRLLGMGDIGGLVGMLQENKILEQKELIKKLQEGKEGFTFRDMHDQFSNLMKLGSLSKVMSMIPGLQQIMGKGKEQESTDRIKRFMTVMDSMSPAELDGDDKIFSSQPSRIIRIAKGAGVPVRAVHEVIETYKPFKKIFKNMQGLPKGMLDANPKPGGRMPQMDMRTISKMFNPQMLKGMGGAANIQNMMKKMGSMMPGMMGGRGGGGPGGMPDMSALMNAMGGMGGMGGMDAD